MLIAGSSSLAVENRGRGMGYRSARPVNPGFRNRALWPRRSHHESGAVSRKEAQLTRYNRKSAEAEENRVTAALPPVV